MLSGECFVIPITDANGGLYAAKLRPSPMCARADGPGSRQAILHPFDPKFCDVWGQAVTATYIHTYIHTRPEKLTNLQPVRPETRSQPELGCV